MKGEGRRATTYRDIGKATYTYRLLKKKVCDVRGKAGKCIKWHYEMKYVSSGRLGGKKKKPSVLDKLSDGQIAKLRAWRKKGISNDKLQAQLDDWGFSVSRRTMTRFFKTRNI